MAVKFYFTERVLFMKIKNFFCCGMAALTMFFMTFSVSAAGIAHDECRNQAVEEIDNVDFVLVSQEEQILDNGQMAEVRTFIEDGVETYASYSGHKKYRCEARFYDTLDQIIVKVWVVGTFYWNSSDDRAYIENDDGDYSIEHPYFEYVSEEYKHGSDQGGLFWGKKYAYAEQSVSYLDNLKKKHTCTLKFDVNVNGDYHWNTYLATNDVSVTQVS